MFLDKKGLYNNVLREAIFETLEMVVLGGRLYRSTRSYLHMYSLFVVTENDPTFQHYTHRGVPQGDVLSHTLFNLVLIGLVQRLLNKAKLSITPMTPASGHLT